ncbi:MAG: hypothetical protein OFPII_42370 [Osedax symbiont Rs1]|nr:MAG: hypothetical protein OFPII_42370 [Osedax symbiont Rs1]
MGAAKIFQFHRRTNILHSVFTLKSRIQDIAFPPCRLCVLGI